MTNSILASTSTLFGQDYLEYLLPELSIHFKNCKSILFIPYASPNGISYQEYTKIVQNAFSKININVQGIQEFKNPANAINNAEGIFTGGGNTFLLVHTLYQKKIMESLKQAITKGTPYLGTSAGSNIAGLTMNNTNDMPIIMPKSFQTLGLIHCNLNPHYLDKTDITTHMGESRETRIKEFHTISSIPVLGLREGSWLVVKDNKCILKGNLTARLFLQDKNAIEIESKQDIYNFI